MNNNQRAAEKCTATTKPEQARFAECATSSSWPSPKPSTVNTSSFLRQLFPDDDEDTGALLLPPPPSSAAFDAIVEDDDKYSPDSIFQLGAFPMVDSFINTAAVPSDPPAEDAQPHTLEFVTSSHYSADAPTSADPDFACVNLPQRHSLNAADNENQQKTTAVKRPKIGLPSDLRISALVDQSQLRPLLSKVSHSQSARSKEKLGERINALQQLVSPYGKTDTASVLSEAIGYIKFLQEQVQVLSSPYMKPTNTPTTINRQDLGAEAASDLRSRGLCLVPVSCTMTVANNNNFNIGADYWASSQNLSSSLASGGTAGTRFSAA